MLAGGGGAQSLGQLVESAVELSTPPSPPPPSPPHYQASQPLRPRGTALATTAFDHLNGFIMASWLMSLLLLNGKKLFLCGF